MRTRMLRRRVICVVCILLLSTAACDRIFTTPIGKILQNPRDYGGKKVTISGEVTDMFSFLVVKCFLVRDDTGELTVVTSKPLPRKGTRIKISGTIEEAFSLGDRQLLVLVEAEPER